MTSLREGELPPVPHDPHMHSGISYCPEHPTLRQVYEDVDKEGPIATISHSHGLQEGELEEYGISSYVISRMTSCLQTVVMCQSVGSFLKCARGLLS